MAKKKTKTRNAYKRPVKKAKAKTKPRVFRKNPIRHAPAFMIVGQTENGKEYFFNGPGFGNRDDVVKYFNSEGAARRKLKEIKNSVPPVIRYLFVHPA